MGNTTEGARKRLETIRSQPGGAEKLRKWAALGGKYSPNRSFRDHDIAVKAANQSAIKRREKRDERLAREEQPA